ncbi:C-type lectin domain family 2 member D11-like, partial [Sigmodon hispidus]
RKTELISVKNTYAACPRDWIGFGSKCFYFSENISNWTYSQTLCKEQEAQLARFDSREEL